MCIFPDLINSYTLLFSRIFVNYHFNILHVNLFDRVAFSALNIYVPGFILLYFEISISNVKNYRSHPWKVP